MNTPATEAFIPLIATTVPNDVAAEFHVTVLGNAEQTQPLHALLKPSGTNLAATKSTACEPRVTLQRDGQRVSGIRIECVCGAVTELACVYDTPTSK